MNLIIVQIIGFIGLFFVVISFQKDKRSFTLFSQLFAGFAFAIHFSLLSAWTGAIMNMISAIRAYVFNQKRFANDKIVMYVLVLFFWIGGVVTWKGYISLLPIISTTIECFALWSKKTKNIRWLFLSARPTWIIYDIIVGSYAGLVTEGFIVASLIISIIRFG